jgi:hypothetical protein
MSESKMDKKIYNFTELDEARMKQASRSWLYETGINNSGTFSEVFTSKDEKKVHKAAKQNDRNYTCRYRREDGCLVIEHYSFGMWN